MISIIVPIYNSSATLSRCIDSILAQTYTDFELLLIDDGSKDTSGDICGEYAKQDTRIRVFHKENGGASSARNLGLDKAQGEWVAFCDADDKVFPNWLGIFVKKSVEFDLIVQSLQTNKPLYSYVPQNKFIYGCSYEGNISDGLLLLDKEYAKGHLCTRLFKRSLIEEHHLRLDERLSYQEDLEFCFRYMTCCQRMSCTEEVGYYYYVPDYTSKYHQNSNLFPLFGSLYSSAIKIFKGKRNYLTDFYLDKYTLALLYKFKNKASDRMECLIRYRKDVGHSMLSTHLFFITKYALWLNICLPISALILALHAKCKNLPELR